MPPLLTIYVNTRISTKSEGVDEHCNDDGYDDDTAYNVCTTMIWRN